MWTMAFMYLLSKPDDQLAGAMPVPFHQFTSPHLGLHILRSSLAVMALRLCFIDHVRLFLASLSMSLVLQGSF